MGKIKSPFFKEFESPKYDERSSVFINAGTEMGSGKTQPVGSFKNSPKFDPTRGLVTKLPNRSTPTLNTEETKLVQ